MGTPTEVVLAPAPPRTLVSPARALRTGVPDLVAVAVLLGLFPVVHDTGSLLHAPYYLDEAWVALSIRFPIGDLPLLASSTPVGWAFLLRLVPDVNYLRVVPLVFHLLTIAGGYALGRQLGWRTPGLARVGGAACGAVVLLLPVQQIRHDLKQYTADAAATLIVLALSAWVEAGWTRRRLVALGAVLVAGTAFSEITAVAGCCAFGGLAVVALGLRRWRRLVEVLVVGAVAGAGAGAVIAATVLRSHSKAMDDFWAASFPTPGRLPHYLWEHGKGLLPLLGAGHRSVALLLACACVLGIGTVFRLGRPGTGTALLLLPVAAVVMGVARVYPLLDLRTSHFLLVAVAATAGLGVAAAAALASRLVRAAPPGLAAGALSAIVVAAFAAANANWYRFDGDDPAVGDPYKTPMASEDIRSAVVYVKAHAASGDVVVLDETARYGFAFYWQPDGARIAAPYGNTVGWTVEFAAPTVFVAPGTTGPDDVRRALDQALDLATRRGQGVRVWLVRSHVFPDERAAWQVALRDYRLDLVTSGVEPVAIVSR